MNSQTSQKGFTPYHFSRKKSDKGFIALISVIIIAAILMLIALTLSFSGFYGRFNILDSELKEKSSAIADACADEVLLSLANDGTYVGNATTTVSGRECYIGAKDSSIPGQATFKLRSIYQFYQTNYRLTLDTGTFSVLSWEELTKF